MMKHFVFLSILLIALSVQMAKAEQADRDKPLRIWAESQTYDGNKKVTVYNGPVHIEKGTLTIDANRLEIVEGSNGKRIASLFGSAEKLVRYRQKRDGGPDLWAEGEAEKIVYDDALALIQFFNNAKLVLLDGKRLTHESSGAYISYDSRTDFMSVNNTQKGVSVPGAGFTHAIIYPDNDPTKNDQTKNDRTRLKSGANAKNNAKGNVNVEANKVPVPSKTGRTTKDNQ